MLVAVHSSVLGRLCNDWGSHVYLTRIAHSLQLYVVAAYDYLRAAIAIEDASQVHISYDNLGSRQYDSPVVVYHSPLLLVIMIDLQVVYLLFQLADGAKYAFLEVVSLQTFNLLFPFLEY